MACSGVFGVPDTTRTCDPGLRRLVLYPTELLGHISKIFNFPPPTDSNELPLRRRSLYPAELLRLISCMSYYILSDFYCQLKSGGNRKIGLVFAFQFSLIIYYIIILFNNINLLH